jgi:hypothetical protein
MGYIQRLESYEEDMLRTLGETIAIPSVNSDPVRTPDGEVYPYGKAVQDALVHMLKTGEEMGFESYNDENYAGHIEWKAEGGSDGYYGIVCHLDVMPEGSGWDEDPYSAVIKDGKIYSGYEETVVEFNDLSPALIKDYVESGLPLDKAGAYGIQDGFDLVKNIDGDYNNVVGLPVNKILEILKGIQ